MIAIGLLGYAFGTVALGAQSFGHEYSYRTLALLLSLPTDRRRLYLYKLVVLSAMLATLAAVTLLLFRDILNLGYRPHTEPSMLVLAAACGLFIAPFLTLVCRSTLAAVVFTIAIPGLLAAGADIVGGLHLRHSAMPRPSTGSSSPSSGAACSSSARCPRSPAGGCSPVSR